MGRIGVFVGRWCGGAGAPVGLLGLIDAVNIADISFAPLGNSVVLRNTTKRAVDSPENLQPVRPGEIFEAEFLRLVNIGQSRLA